MRPRDYSRLNARARHGAFNPIPKDAGDIALLARNDLAIFGEYVCGKKPAVHHQEWIAELVTNRSNDSLKLIAGEDTEILAPRGSAKSTWIGFFVAWVIGHNPGIQIIYVSCAESIAISRGRLIRRIIESSKYQEVFPNISKSNRWTDTLWEIDKGKAGVNTIDSDYTFYSVGVTGSIVSRRSNLIIGDDLIKSSQSIKNREIREQMVENWNEVICPTLIPGGRIVDIGTRFRRDDIHASEFTQDKGWRQIIQKAVLTDEATGIEKSFWEDRFELGDLQSRRERNPVAFSFQYQNEIIGTGTESIDYEWIRRGDIPMLDKFEEKILGIDLASSLKNRADFTAFVLVGRYLDSYYVIDCRFGKWIGNLDKFDTIKQLYEEWGEFEILVESVSYQSSFIKDFDDWINREEETKSTHGLTIKQLRCNGIKLKGDKLQRLSGFKGLFQRGKVIFNQYRLMSKLIDEICNLGTSVHDDGCDAFVYALSGLVSRRRLDTSDTD
jgi:hypothetical protein